MNSSKPERVVVIGGGFSGVLAAVNLARIGRPPPQITVINAQRPTGRGAAYSTRRMEHLLNVAARNMSVFPDLPDHFVNWLRTRAEFDLVPEAELRERFIPRMIYGDYLRSLMLHWLPEAEFINGDACDIEPGGVVLLADGRRIEAGRIVLATGNEAPADLPGTEELHAHPAWVGDPWLAWHDRLPPDTGSILLLGTGLTTVDAIITLRALGWLGRIHAVSRHGWLPHAHFRGIDYPDFPPPGVDLAELGLESLVALMEQHCERLRELGANPAIIVDKMRPHTQRIWRNFTVQERLEFARRHAARWNILRHRIAPDIHAQLASAQLMGQLQVHAANINRVEAAGSQVRVLLDGGAQLTADLVINATGPQTRFSSTRSVLLQNLIRRGLIMPDDMDMGVRVDSDHTVITPDGARSDVLLALGPLLRGSLWETIAVPELRGQAMRVAQTLLDQTPEAATEPAAVMMEYMI
ncbi:FAD/NAD(P)-binding protein [Prosthecobacter sp.]|uniref:FAD/NAD(P)-binding protein n=1 Tax=Prosthecobacter sp. TaxID=1965333 RepID=UPI001D31DEE6|nr:FAD/NAD(P)-binding protein [Prosthecobacter sp.]MCB1277825.1 FAD-dependent oxidoreductase [Prosthecobacter sp.]